MDNSSGKLRKVIAVAHDNSGSRRLYERVTQAYPDIEFGLVITTGLYYKSSLVRSLYRLVRDSSVIFCAVRAIDMFRYLLSGDTLTQLAKRKGIFWFKTDDVNSAESLRRIAEFKPDLLLSLYTMHIYRKPILEIPPLGGIGTHPSILPEYRGLEVFFWAMVNEEETIGVCVFTTESKVDGGRVLNGERMPLPKEQSMASVYSMVTEKAAELLIKSIDQIRNNAVAYRVAAGQGSYYPMPTRAAVRKFLKLRKKFW